MTDLETARRDAVARLCFAQASGLLSVETFGERYALVTEATSVATLEALIADLAPDDATPLPVGTRSVAIQAVHDDFDYPTSYTTRPALAVAAAVIHPDSRGVRLGGARRYLDRAGAHRRHGHAGRGQARLP